MSKIEAIVQRLFLQGSALSKTLRIAALVALVPVLLALPFVDRQYKEHRAAPVARLAPSSPVPDKAPLPSEANLTARPLYPYSVIPGGAYSPEELANAIAHDPVVASHYVGFDLTKAQIIRLDRDEMDYVSYRLGDQVFWTKRKLLVPKGEMLLTDGTHEARTRCGNRLSDQAVQPTSAKQPSPEALESLEDWLPNPDLIAGNYMPAAAVTGGGPPLPGGEGSGSTAIPPASFPLLGGGGGGGDTPSKVTPPPPGSSGPPGTPVTPPGSPVPPGPPITPPPGSSGPPGTPAPPPGWPTPPGPPITPPPGSPPPSGTPPSGPPGTPIATPEPGSLLLLLSGAGSILALARRKKRRG